MLHGVFVCAWTPLYPASGWFEYVGLSDIFPAGNGDVSRQLQPELQKCIIVQELELVTAANCQRSADVWIASQPLALSALAALTSDIQQCSMQQVISFLGFTAFFGTCLLLSTCPFFCTHASGILAETLMNLSSTAV